MTYTTTDLAAAAYLVYRGAVLLRLIPGSWCAFQFDDADGSTGRYIEEWNTGAPTGDLKAYAMAQQKLRRELYRAA